MRTVFALLAAGWFLFQALTFLPFGTYANSGAPGGIDGDLGGVAVTWAARAAFAGLTALALALIDWEFLFRLGRPRA
ncbi:MAG TPA: hypothetical protein VH859_00750 [Candidatus Limnocylindria bacterium]|jgi:hypothetical protein